MTGDEIIKALHLQFEELRERAERAERDLHLMKLWAEAEFECWTCATCDCPKGSECPDREPDRDDIASCRRLGHDVRPMMTRAEAVAYANEVIAECINCPVGKRWLPRWQVEGHSAAGHDVREVSR